MLLIVTLFSFNEGLLTLIFQSFRELSHSERMNGGIIYVTTCNVVFNATDSLLLLGLMSDSSLGAIRLTIHLFDWNCSLLPEIGQFLLKLCIFALWTKVNASFVMNLLVSESFC